MNTHDDDPLVMSLRARAAAGASMRALIDHVHEERGREPYSGGLILYYFYRAFRLKPLDFSSTVLGCEIFGDGATRRLDDCEQRFRERLVELGVVANAPTE